MDDLVSINGGRLQIFDRSAKLFIREKCDKSVEPRCVEFFQTNKSNVYCLLFRERDRERNNAAFH